MFFAAKGKTYARVEIAVKREGEKEFKTIKVIDNGVITSRIWWKRLIEYGNRLLHNWQGRNS